MQFCTFALNKKNIIMKKAILSLISVVAVTGFFSFTAPIKHQPATYTVATDASKVEWTGSKKAGYHTGAFNLKSGSVTVDNGKLTGGQFFIDLASLKSTEPTGGERLEGHLKSPEFFDVSKFGEATFTITSVNYTSETNVDISGNLSIKGATVALKFPAVIRNADDKKFFGEAFFSLNSRLLPITDKYSMPDVQLAIHLFGTK
jgi:polyisoprenoid-binding protein YceI